MAKSAKEGAATIPKQRPEQQQRGKKTPCIHGHIIGSADMAMIEEFLEEFTAQYNAAPSGKMMESIFIAQRATNDKYAAVWQSSKMLKYAASHQIAMGTQDILDLEGGDRDEDYERKALQHSRGAAAFAYFFEQYIAVEVNHTQSSYNSMKMSELFRWVRLLSLFIIHIIPKMLGSLPKKDLTFYIFFNIQGRHAYFGTILEEANPLLMSEAETQRSEVSGEDGSMLPPWVWPSQSDDCKEYYGVLHKM